QPQGPGVHSLEHRRPAERVDRRVHRRKVGGRPEVGPHQQRVRPLLRLDPLLPPPVVPGREHGGLVRRQRVPRHVRLHRRRRVPDALRRRAVHRVHLRRTRHARHPCGVHLADGPHRATAAVVAGLPPVPLVPLHPGRGGGDRRTAPGRGHPVRRAVARHRVHGRLPRLHLGHRRLPGRRRDAGAAGRRRLPRHHDHRPRGQARAGLPGVRRGGRARRAVQDGRRGHVHRTGVARQHRLPRLRDRGGTHLVGRAERRARAVGGGRHLERHERAGHRRHPAGRHALRPRPPCPRAVPQPVRAADGDGDDPGAAGRHTGPAPVRAVASRLRRDPALRRQLDGRQPVALGPPRGEHPDGLRAGRLRAGVRRCRRGRLPGQHERRAFPAVDAVRRADAVLPQPLRDRQRRPVRVGLRRRRPGPRAR
ncbi:MAG: GH31, partial [uncultured Phycisphaerae bacterium]